MLKFDAKIYNRLQEGFKEYVAAQEKTAGITVAEIIVKAENELSWQILEDDFENNVYVVSVAEGEYDLKMYVALRDLVEVAREEIQNEFQYYYDVFFKTPLLYYDEAAAEYQVHFELDLGKMYMRMNMEVE